MTSSKPLRTSGLLLLGEDCVEHGLLVFIGKTPIDVVLLSAMPNILLQRYVLGHRHLLLTSHLFDQRITFLVIAMGMVSQQDLDVRKFAPKVGDRFSDC